MPEDYQRDVKGRLSEESGMLTLWACAVLGFDWKCTGAHRR